MRVAAWILTVLLAGCLGAAGTDHGPGTLTAPDWTPGDSWEYTVEQRTGWYADGFRGWNEWRDLEGGITFIRDDPALGPGRLLLVERDVLPLREGLFLHGPGWQLEQQTVEWDEACDPVCRPALASVDARAAPFLPEVPLPVAQGDAWRSTGAYDGLPYVLDAEALGVRELSTSAGVFQTMHIEVMGRLDPDRIAAFRSEVLAGTPWQADPGSHEVEITFEERADLDLDLETGALVAFELRVELFFRESWTEQGDGMESSSFLGIDHHARLSSFRPGDGGVWDDAALAEVLGLDPPGPAADPVTWSARSEGNASQAGPDAEVRYEVQADRPTQADIRWTLQARGRDEVLRRGSGATFSHVYDVPGAYTLEARVEQEGRVIERFAWHQDAGWTDQVEDVCGAQVDPPACLRLDLERGVGATGLEVVASAPSPPADLGPSVLALLDREGNILMEDDDEDGELRLRAGPEEVPGATAAELRPAPLAGGEARIEASLWF